MTPRSKVIAPSPGALRMRRSRERRRQGDMIVSVEVGPKMTADLADLGWLPAPDRVDKDALARTLVGLINQAIGMRVTPSPVESERACFTPVRVTAGRNAIGFDESVGLSPRIRAPAEGGGPEGLRLRPLQTGEVLGAGDIAEQKPSEAQPCDFAPRRPFEIDPVQLWGPRLSLYQRRRMWMPQWGPRPDQDGCLAPDYLL